MAKKGQIAILPKIGVALRRFASKPRPPRTGGSLLRRHERQKARHFWRLREAYTQTTEPHVHHRVRERSKQVIYPRESLKNIQYLLLRDRLIRGLRVGFRRRSEDRVNVDIDKREQLRMEWGGGFTELPVDPVLEGTKASHIQFPSWRAILCLQLCHFLTSYKKS